MLTRKYYVLLADAIARADQRVMGIDPVARVGVTVVMELVADVLAEDNPRFDRLYFFGACRQVPPFR